MGKKYRLAIVYITEDRAVNAQKKDFELVLVAASTRGWIIGNKGRLPWEPPEADLRHFRKLTMGKPVIMGSVAAFEIICLRGRLLPGRYTIVITSNSDAADIMRLHDGIVARDPNKALEKAREVLNKTRQDPREVIIAGGARTYASFLPFADRIEMTFVNMRIQGDAYFPSKCSAEEGWRLIKEIDDQSDVLHPLTFTTYRRI